MPTVLITGASRGLGLEFARQYAAAGWQVHASCRDPESARALRDLASGGKVSLHRLDVDDGASVAACAGETAADRFDLILNNAGVSGSRGAGFADMDYDSFAATLNTNVLGPMRVIEAFAGRLTGEKKLVTVSSQMGSIARAAANSVIYRTSKAAANMLTRCAALELGRRGVIVAAVHPGWVATDMGGRGAALSPAESVGHLRRLIANLRPADNGGFFNYDGSPIPW
jgi:NAD(P)-dependent dehydrogenase (short-subunit alcohol dehydrogenase family)